MIAGVEPLDCGYRVVGNLLLLLAISEIIHDLGRTLGDCRMSVNTQPAIACLGLIMEMLEQHVGCVLGWWLCICIFVVYMYVFMYVHVYMYVCIYIYECAYVCLYI